MGGKMTKPVDHVSISSQLPNQMPSKCPICLDAKYVKSCNCVLKNYTCSNNHSWYMIGNMKIIGKHHHS